MIEVYNRLTFISPPEKRQREITDKGEKKIQTIYIYSISKLCEIIELYRDRIEDVDFFMDQIIMKHNMYRENI